MTQDIATTGDYYIGEETFQTQMIASFSDATLGCPQEYAFEVMSSGVSESDLTSAGA